VVEGLDLSGVFDLSGSSEDISSSTQWRKYELFDHRRETINETTETNALKEITQRVYLN
jgi:hypothetical protein